MMDTGQWILEVITLSITGTLNAVFSKEHKREILLGKDANGGKGEMERARKWIIDHGGATAIIS
ncbi:hypothetical protein QQ045_004175 [Rhodiola kirilowii]